MSKEQTTLTYTNPKYIDGTPYEAAAAALKQAAEIVALAHRALVEADSVLLSAEMERYLALRADITKLAAGWPGEAVLGLQVENIKAALATAQQRLNTAALSAAWDPKAPID